MRFVLTGGDDYGLLATFPPEVEPAGPAGGSGAGFSTTGEPGEVTVDGEPYDDAAGHRHFSVELTRRSTASSGRPSRAWPACPNIVGEYASELRTASSTGVDHGLEEVVHVRAAQAGPPTAARRGGRRAARSLRR